MNDDPRWQAFYAVLQVNARVVERVGGAIERETGLPPSWFEVLAVLCDGPRRMHDLADKLTLSRGGATRLVARMEEAGLVSRETPREDRRATYARLTPQGDAALERAQPIHLAAVEEFFGAHLSLHDATALREACTKVLAANGASVARSA
jgi:DNA-binding MarR family transcriptional regulator